MIGSQLISEGKTTALIFLSLIFGGLGAMFAGMLFMRSHLTFSNEQFANYWSPFALNRSELYSEEIIEFEEVAVDIDDPSVPGIRHEFPRCSVAWPSIPI